MSRTERELAGLVSNVIDAAKGIPPWGLPQSVLGRLRFALPPSDSEYVMFVSRDIARTTRYLGNILVPSLQRHGPEWIPAAVRQIFFHQTTIQREPDHLGGYDSFPQEQWFFINGILTDSGMATWNAAYLARIFHRPFTVIQNATDGPIADLLECADEKAFGMNGEPVDVAFPEIHRALKDDSKERVVVIAHSQGTIIAGVILRLLRLLYPPSAQAMSEAERAQERAALRRAGVTLDHHDLQDITTAELERLEIYCFANCATQMRYLDPQRALPWIESFGNEHDLVARLGMLAPDLKAEEIEIDGPLWVRPGGWGHLLNHHYLREIFRAQGDGPGPGPATATAAPYELMSRGDQVAPRLYAYINGGVPAD